MTRPPGIPVLKLKVSFSCQQFPVPVALIHSRSRWDLHLHWKERIPLAIFAISIIDGVYPLLNKKNHSLLYLTVFTYRYFIISHSMSRVYITKLKYRIYNHTQHLSLSPRSTLLSTVARRGHCAQKF